MRRGMKKMDWNRRIQVTQAGSMVAVVYLVGGLVLTCLTSVAIFLLLIKAGLL